MFLVGVATQSYDDENVLRVVMKISSPALVFLWLIIFHHHYYYYKYIQELY